MYRIDFIILYKYFHIVIIYCVKSYTAFKCDKCRHLCVATAIFNNNVVENLYNL